ncbi:uncharacterized protein C8orf59 homolog [Heterocephalus glaber]|uniref:Uncharacterized protein C8orf59 homolog n=1 Tax=Heterocephalus glaber TaxID=10181 RepID=A0AAX6TDQ6_HETGA|nr:uncharacterized protein C8orf59 homolog [Heterocephalus glaber]
MKNRWRHLELEQQHADIKDNGQEQIKGQKSRNVFHIASQKNLKSKNKAKPVTTNLKMINIQHHEDEPVNVDEAARLMAQL